MAAFTFSGQLRNGKVGEALFYQAHPGTLTMEDGRKRDFSMADGSGLELKTDQYSMDKTPYFFMERWSSSGKPGGPWQAQANGTAHYAYFYVTNLTYYMFNTDKLVERLEPMLAELTPVEVGNKTWTTIGYKVERAKLADLATEVKLAIGVAA